MSVELTNPLGLPVVPLYHHVSLATGTQLVHIAGQVSQNSAGEVVGADDLAAQVEQCLLNIAVALQAAGASVQHLVDLTAYFVDVTDQTAAAYVQGSKAAAQRLGVAIPAVPFTGVGVVALAGPDLLVEIKAVAVLP